MNLLMLFLFPLIGLGLDFWLSKKTTLYILISFIVLLSPLLIGYNYVIENLWQLFALLALASAYSFYSRKIEKRATKVITPIVISTLLFVILGYTSFMGSLAGTQRIEKEWFVDGYKVVYIRDQGFVGGALLKYELNKYGLGHILIKKLETTREGNSFQDCNIIFERSHIHFNKCDGTIIKDKR